MGYRIAIVGATGNVGREMLNILEDFIHIYLIFHSRLLSLHNFCIFFFWKWWKKGASGI